MADFYFAIHVSFENTNAIFLDPEKCRTYIEGQISNGIGEHKEWRMYKWKEGVPFEAEILQFQMMTKDGFNEWE